jgi:hypothetical protein
MPAIKPQQKRHKRASRQSYIGNGEGANYPDRE